MHFYFIILVSALQSSCIYTMNNSNFFIEWEHNSSKETYSAEMLQRSKIIKESLHNQISPETIFESELIQKNSNFTCSLKDFQLLCKFGLSNEKKEIMALQSIMQQKEKMLDVCFQEGVDPEKIALEPVSQEVVEMVSAKTITNHLEYIVHLHHLYTIETFFKYASTTLKTKFILFSFDQLYADRIDFCLQISNDKNSLIQKCEKFYQKNWNTIINDNASYSLSIFEKNRWQSLKQHKENILWQKLRNLFE